MSAAAPNLGRASGTDPDVFSEEGLEQAITTILVAPQLKVGRHVDTVVLGAWGCGAFGHDPGEIAELFAELLRGEFVGCFRVVAFALVFSQKNIDALAARFPLVGAAPGCSSDAERIAALQAAAGAPESSG